MSDTTAIFSALIESDRAHREQYQWQGNFLEYLEKVKADPSIPKLAHTRIYDAIMSQGVRNISAINDPHLEFLQDTLHKAYLEMLEKEITKAFVYSFEEQAEALYQNYLDHTEAYVNKTRVKDRNTGEELQADESFLKSVEEQIAVVGSSAQGFRQEVMAYLWAKIRRGESVNYQSYEPLKEAIEKKLMSSVREMSRIITKARTRDEEQTSKYNDLVKALLERGYNEHSAEVVLKYAANNLWKD